MADDIVERLRDTAYEVDLCWEASAEIERLRAELDDAQREAAMQQAEVVRLRIELAAANADAERLAWTGRQLPLDDGSLRTWDRHMALGDCIANCPCCAIERWKAALAAHRARISRREEESHAPTAAPASPDE